MRKIVVVLILSVFLSGCSILEEVNDTLAYANKATEHINTWNEFGQDAPALLQTAAINIEDKAKLEAELKNLLAEIDAFNQTKAPAIAEGIHEQIVVQNENIKSIITASMANGELVVEKLEGSELLTLISEITKLATALEALGN